MNHNAKTILIFSVMILGFIYNLTNPHGQKIESDENGLTWEYYDDGSRGWMGLAVLLAVLGTLKED